MTLADLAALGSFVSGLAVVLSLVYLTIQTRQNSKHTQALISQGRVNQILDFSRDLATNRELADVYARGMVADSKLPPVDLMRFYFCMFVHFATAEEDYRQHVGGLIDGPRHQGLVDRITRNFQMPGYRAMWNIQSFGFDAEFRTYMEDLAKRAKSAPILNGISAAWESAIATERPA